MVREVCLADFISSIKPGPLGACFVYVGRCPGGLFSTAPGGRFYPKDYEKLLVGN